MKEKQIADWILYSTCDEDAYSELKALKVSNEDEVLCVTGSACRVLSLLAEKPKNITAIDFAAGQNYLLELKIAAIKNLTYDQLLGFFGVEQMSKEQRWKYFISLKDKITDEAFQYFCYYCKEIKEGVLYRGRHEKFYVYFLSPFLHFLYGKEFKEMFETECIERQKEIYFKKIRGPFWRLMIKKGFSKWLLKGILNNKDYETEFEVGDLGNYMLKTLDHTFSTHLAKYNDWLSMMINGRYLGRHAMPHFLSKDSYESIRNANTKIEIITMDLVDYCKKVKNERFSVFSLSDVSSCISKPRFNELLSQLPRLSRSRGRLCYRNFISRHKIPNALSQKIQIDVDMCNQLNHSDRAFSYQFEVALINN
ncbi:DUF3419 family protein [Xenorhabdus taiwanensis]|uniref:S-adenosylmethionine:diacylglycerol 3-amino-3-carboxypropyl transferase n=1 Tax=Xenorhabdus taiwanensis TaxID=3085177 RepID=A0ABM8JTD7_9GAMM|nr:hypothetical protein TCT1_08720 [Xenorhabdus sp. TCT-1]